MSIYDYIIVVFVHQWWWDSLLFDDVSVWRGRQLRAGRQADVEHVVLVASTTHSLPHTHTVVIVHTPTAFIALSNTRMPRRRLLLEGRKRSYVTHLEK